MSYYNYHGIATKLISQGHCVKAEFFETYNKISPALVLFFDNHRPMPIREHKFDFYLTLLNYNDVPIIN